MTYWKAARLIVFVLGVLPPIIVTPNEPMADWRISLIAAAIFGPILFVWLKLLDGQIDDRSDPYSWNVPFFPLTKYPRQFWLLASLSLLVGGLLAFVTSYLLEYGNESLAVSYLLIGCSTMLSVQASIKFAQKTLTNS